MTGLRPADLDPLKAESEIDMRVYFVTEDGQDHEVRFRLVRITRKDIAWET